MGLCEASGCAAELYLDDIPLMRGAAELAEAGIRSILFPQNRALALSLPAGAPRPAVRPPDRRRSARRGGTGAGGRTAGRAA
ncbi:hypothetical protein ACFOHS_10520 [Jhaorihella thermophila]